MAAPLNTAKATVDLGAPGKRGSRIRRDPPAKARKEMTIAERDERDRRATLLGIAAYTLGMVVVLVMVASYTGWSPRQVVIDIQQ